MLNLLPPRDKRRDEEEYRTVHDFQLIEVYARFNISNFKLHTLLVTTAARVSFPEKSDEFLRVRSLIEMGSI